LDRCCTRVPGFGVYTWLQLLQPLTRASGVSRDEGGQWSGGGEEEDRGRLKLYFGWRSGRLVRRAEV